MADLENEAPPDEAYTEEEEVIEEGKIGTLRWVKETLQRAPWWAASAIFHLVLLVIAAYIVRNPPAKPVEATIEMRVTNPISAEKLRLPEKRSLVEREGLPGKEEPDITDKAIFFPEAEESDHNESDDNDEHHQMKGDSFDFISSQKGMAGGIRGNTDSNQQAIYD